MKKRKDILKPHKEFTQCGNFSYERKKKNENEVVLEHMTEIGEDEIIFTAAVRISTKTVEGRKILSEMIKKQSSPIKIVLQKFDNENNRNLRDGRGIEEYYLPEDIIQKLE